MADVVDLNERRRAVEEKEERLLTPREVTFERVAEMGFSLCVSGVPQQEMEQALAEGYRRARHFEEISRG